MEIRIKVNRKGIRALSNPHGKIFCCAIFRENGSLGPTTAKDIQDVITWTKREVEGFLKMAKKKRA